MNKRELIGRAALCAAAGVWIGGSFAATGAARAGKSPDQLSPLIVNEPAEHFFVAVTDQLELETDGKRNEFADLWDFRLPKLGMQTTLPWAHFSEMRIRKQQTPFAWCISEKCIHGRAESPLTLSKSF